MSEINRPGTVCRRCVLPESPPDIHLDGSGLCNICAAWDKEGKGSGKEFPETELLRTINKHKGRGKYDCLVMCSGGKDSTMALHQAVKRYRLKALAFTFDHGFENAEALANVRNAVKFLDTDWFYLRTAYMRGIFAKMLDTDTKAPMCHVCALWYIRETFSMAARFGIPIIIGGWTRGQASISGEDQPEFKRMSEETRNFVEQVLRQDPRWKDFPRDMTEAVAGLDRRIAVLSPHWFLRHEPQDAMSSLEKELGWARTPNSYPGNSTNCLMNFMSVDRTINHFGYTHYHVEFSRLIRLGEMSRDEAMGLLKMNFAEDTLKSLRAGLRMGK